ncbi:response regulator [Dyadobacter sp. CY356]|uniref:response regulator n=1 Tax=Dyadobacter sp. CY356 TaxID=2906442 RepID=UPI001F270B38|nr:response regulator [Dyadobacter sp. CY356]MCF0054527.1 response regulator [Dyadobacter sp. CY356]
MENLEKEIFIVEDSADFRQIVRTIFAQYLPKYHIRSFMGVQELFKYMILQSDENFKGRRPVLIILDLKIPPFGGLEILKMLRQTPSNAVTVWETIPVIMLSSIARQEDINECYKAGAASYFIKPVEVEDLKQMLIKICNYWVDDNKLASVTGSKSLSNSNQ